MHPRLSIPNQWQTPTKHMVLCCGFVGLSFLAIVWFGLLPRIQAAENILPHRQVSAGPTKIQPKLVASYGKLPLSFEPNQGQVRGPVQFLSRGRGYTLFLTGDEAVLELEKSSVVSGQSSVAGNTLSSVGSGRLAEMSKAGQRATENGPRTTGSVLRMKLVGANVKATVTGAEELPGKSNYFIGNEPKKWRTNVPSYARVKYEGVYPGVDLVYYGNQRQLEYDFVVAPGADPDQIKLSFAGADGMRVDAASGDLVLDVGDGEVHLKKPVVYQPSKNPESQTANPAKHVLDGHYVLLADNRAGFEVSGYDPSRPLIIDPVLSYATYLGGGGGDEASSIAVDASGNAYVAGSTTSSDFPTTGGAFQETSTGSCAFVTKIAPDGRSLVYSTYLCGSNGVQGVSMAVDPAGNAYVVGGTSSTNFPTTPGAFQTANAGGTCGSPPGSSPCLDAFVTKLNSTGSSLVYSTYLGGSGDDYAYSYSNGIAVDSAGRAYVVGTTNSGNFPTTPGAFDRTLGGAPDNFVTKLNADGSALVYSTYLGGSGYEEQYNAIAIDSSGNAYVTGGTNSADFPITPGAFRTSGGGIFVTKLNAAGSALVYSTYLTGRGDIGEGIAVDTSGNAYVTGYLGSHTDFPITPGAFQTSGGGTFVTKLNATGSALAYSTYLGGSGSDEGWGVAVDALGNAYVSGTTESSDFPTVSPVQATCGVGGHSDAFVAKLNGAGSALIFSTCMGGDSSEEGYGNALDPSGNLYVVGYTSSIDFPTTLGAFQTSLGGGSDAFVAKISAVTGGDFSLTANPTSATVTAGQTASYSLSITPAGGFSQAVALSCSGAPQNATCSISPSSVTLNGSSSATATLTVTTSASTPVGNYTIAVTGSSGSLSHTVSVSLSVNASTGGTPAASLSSNNACFTEANKLLCFATQILNAASLPQTVTVTNSGTAALTFSATPSASGDFVVTTDGTTTCSTGSAVPPSASCVIALTFTPTAASTRTGTLTIASNAPGNSPQVQLVGYGMQGFSQSGAPTYFDNDACPTPAEGCTLMSTASMLTTFNANVNPTSLNSFLSANGGYCPGACSLMWEVVPQFMRQPALATPIHLAGFSDVVNDLVKSTSQNYQTYLTDQVVQQGNRVLLGLTYCENGKCGPHYLVVTAPYGASDWEIFDPDFNSAQLSTAQPRTLSEYLAGFNYYPSSTDLLTFATFSVTTVRTYGSGSSGGLSVVACSPVELLVADPQGRRLGNLGSGNDVFEIPSASYSRDYPLADDTGGGTTVGDPAGVKTAYIPSPMEGTYTVTATGTQSGAYTLNVQGVATDGSVQVTTVSGTASAGSSSQYQVAYSPTPGTPVTVTPLPAVSLSAPSLTFGSQAVSTTSPAQAVTVTNTGVGPLAISGIAVQGDFAQTNSCGTGVAAGSNCTINVMFKPTVPGTQTGTLTITDNSNGVAGSTQTVSLSGTGTGPMVSLSPPLTFSQLVGTTSSSQTVTLTNTGNASLTFTAISLTGPFAIATSGTPCSTSNPVAAAATCTVAVTFTPTAEGTASGNLSFGDNAPNSPQTVALSGTGQDFTLAASSGSSTSASVAPGGTATYSLTITSLDGFNQAVNFTCSGAPSDAPCQLSANSLTPSSSGTTLTVSVATIAPSVSAPRSRHLPTVPPLSPGLRGLLMLALVLTAIAWAMGRRNQPGVTRWQSTMVLLASGLLLTLALAGCGGGGGSANVTHNPGTPAGTYTLTVTGTTGSGSSALSHSVTLTLTVS